MIGGDDADVRVGYNRNKIISKAKGGERNTPFNWFENVYLPSIFERKI